MQHDLRFRVCDFTSLHSMSKAYLQPLSIGGSGLTATLVIVSLLDTKWRLFTVTWVNVKFWDVYKKMLKSTLDITDLAMPLLRCTVPNIVLSLWWSLEHWEQGSNPAEESTLVSYITISWIRTWPERHIFEVLIHYLSCKCGSGYKA